MEKIYSRNRIRVPKLYYSKFTNAKVYTRKAKITLILIIAIIVMTLMVKGIGPIIDKICIDVSKSKATMIANKQATEVMNKYSYEDMITIYRDNNGNVNMIKSNIVTINEITSNVALKIQEELERDNESKAYLRLGSLMGTRIMSGVGPGIPIKLSTNGTVTTKVRSEFESSGINQTIHRLYLYVNCNVNILTPYNVIHESIDNEIVLIENIIVGLVPSTYYNLEGMEKNNLTDLVE